MNDVDNDYDNILVLSSILRRGALTIGTPNGYVATVIDGCATVEYAIGNMEVHVGHEFRRGDGVIGKVLETQEIHMVAHYSKWVNRYRGLAAEELSNYGTVVGLPIFADNTLAYIFMYVFQEQDITTSANVLEDLQAIGKSASVVIQRIESHSEPLNMVLPSVLPYVLPEGIVGQD